MLVLFLSILVSSVLVYCFFSWILVSLVLLCVPFLVFSFLFLLLVFRFPAFALDFWVQALSSLQLFQMFGDFDSEISIFLFGNTCSRLMYSEKLNNMGDASLSFSDPCVNKIEAHAESFPTCPITWFDTNSDISLFLILLLTWLCLYVL